MNYGYFDDEKREYVIVRHARSVGKLFRLSCVWRGDFQ